MTTTHIFVPASEIDKLNSQVLAITKFPVEEAGYPAGLRKATERFLANIDARNLAIGSNLIQQHAKDFLDVLEKIVPASISLYSFLMSAIICLIG